MGPTTIYEYIELISKRISKLEKDIQAEVAGRDPKETISEKCQELVEEHYTAYDFFKFMHENRPTVIDEITEKLPN